METGEITNPVAMLAAITKRDMMINMIGIISIIDSMGIITGITKSGMDIVINGTKNIINARITNAKDIIIGRFIGCNIIIIIVRHMKGPFSDSN
jgi:hypothetical protein